MRHWESALGGEGCGSCGRALEAGAPVQVVTVARLQGKGRRRLRCHDCAEGPVDREAVAAHIEARVMPTPERAPHQPTFASVRQMAEVFDPKKAAANDDQ